MYKVLLVDDERIIRDGIAQIVDWEANGFVFLGAAKNAMEAYDMIRQHSPDIVITDIKMPVMSGLELIRKAKEVYKDISFIILSGYGEFELASEAMRYGVQHYLLKPCNENQIINALNNVKRQISHEKQKEELVLKSEERFKEVLPLVKEQFLQNYIMDEIYTQDQIEYYMSLLGIGESSIRLILFGFEGDFQDITLNTLNQRITEKFGVDDIIIKTIIDNQVLALAYDFDEQELINKINGVKENYLGSKKGRINIVYSESCNLEEIPVLYKKLDNYLYNMSHDGILKKYNAIVQKIIEYIDLNLEDENLSLKWIANNILYMDEGYLSKLFSRELGEKFSQYLTRKRMENATEILRQNDYHKIYDVAQKVGLGNNPQYFSQLFKKYTGHSPTDYIKKNTSD